MTNQELVYEYLQRKKHGASVAEMANHLDRSGDQVRNAIGGLRRNGIKIDNNKQNQTFRLS